MKNVLIPELSKIVETIDFIKKHEPPEGYYLGFSGGKDSVLIYDLAVKAKVKFFPYYISTGIDPPEISRFIKKEYPNVKWLHPDESFFSKLKRLGFPTQYYRWCCTKIKKAPANKIKLQHRLLGLRKEESSKRAKRPRIDDYAIYHQTIYKPIFNWLEWEVWEYIEENKLPVCSLYDEGFNRLGCVVCPFICGNATKIAKAKAKWPKQYYAFEKAMRVLYEWKFVEHVESFDEFLNAWYEGRTPQGIETHIKEKGLLF